MNKNSCYAFYGSLRQGMYNYQHFQRHLTYLFSESLPGFRMYVLKEHPMAIKTNVDTDTIIVEVMRITNPEVEGEIHDLELQAGYYYDEVVVRGTVAGIYLFHEIGEHPLVDGGDWVNFFGQKE